MSCTSVLSTLLSNESFLIVVPTMYKRNAGTSETETKECWLSIVIIIGETLRKYIVNNFPIGSRLLIGVVDVAEFQSNLVADAL